MVRHTTAVAVTALYALAVVMAAVHAGTALPAGAVVLAGLAARVGSRLRRRPAQAAYLTVEGPTARPAVR